MNLVPMRDYLLVRLLPEPPKSERLIVFSSPARAQPAEIVAVGPEVRDLTPGLKVLISRLAGQDVGDKVLLQEASVLATL